MKTKKITPNLIIKMHKSALATRKNSHSPYSGYKVGASVLMDNGKIYGGCNVENASYGGTVCAERIAIYKGISDGAKKIVGLMVVTDANPPWPPCGFCRQVICEFAGPDTPVFLANTKKVAASISFKDLLPFSFSEDNLY